MNDLRIDHKDELTVSRLQNRPGKVPALERPGVCAPSTLPHPNTVKVPRSRDQKTN
jgi:hypothetical protein